MVATNAKAHLLVKTASSWRPAYSLSSHAAYRTCIRPSQPETSCLTIRTEFAHSHARRGNERSSNDARHLVVDSGHVIETFLHCADQPLVLPSRIHLALWQNPKACVKASCCGALCILLLTAPSSPALLDGGSALGSGAPPPPLEVALVVAPSVSRFKQLHEAMLDVVVS